MSSREVLEAYARLKALRENLPDQPVGMPYVGEYHEVLDILESARKVSLRGFRIPDAQIRPVAVGSNYVTGEVHYSGEPFCDHSFFLMKVDGALTLFDLLDAAAAGGRPPVTFRPPE